MTQFILPLPLRILICTVMFTICAGLVLEALVGWWKSRSRAKANRQFQDSQKKPLEGV